MNHRCFGCWALSLLLLVALVTTTHLEQGLTVKVMPDTEEHGYHHHFHAPTVCAVDTPMELRPYPSTLRVPTNHNNKAIQVAFTESAVALMDRSNRESSSALQHQVATSLPVLPYSDSTSFADFLKPVLMEVAALVVFQVFGIPLLSKVFAICCNYGGVGALISRVPWVKNAGRFKHIWKVTYHSSRPPLRMLRKAQKFIKNWYGPEQYRQQRRRSNEVAFPAV